MVWKVQCQKTKVRVEKNSRNGLRNGERTAETFLLRQPPPHHSSASSRALMDVEMCDAKDSQSATEVDIIDITLALTSRENSPAPAPAPAHDIRIDDDLKPPPSKKIKTSQSPPVSAAGAGTTAKPKSAKAPRARSRSPTPPQRPPPLQTIRLEIPLGGPDKYEVDIASLAKATGQRAATPPAPKPDISDSDGEETDGAKPKKKRVLLTPHSPRDGR